MKKTAVQWLAILGLLFPAPSLPGQLGADKDKTFQNAYALISESDLYCSFFVPEEEPRMKIAAGERGAEKLLLTDGDLFYFKAGPEEGLKEGQVLMVLELGPKISGLGLKKSPGPMAFRRGRARLVRFDKNLAVGRLEKSCGPVVVGNYLVPFVEKEGLLGKDLGFDTAVRGGESPSGRIIFLESQFTQIGPGQWALIDLGRDQGLQFGQQLTLVHQAVKGLPPEAVGNAIVIDAGRITSTIKVLSARDTVVLGDLVQVK
jgi:hypothetical protein